MADVSFTDDDPHEAGLRAARLGEAAEQSGNLAQAIELYRHSLHSLEQIGAPEAERVRHRLIAAELKLKLEPVFQAQGKVLQDLIDQIADMSDEELAAFIQRQAQQSDDHD